MKSFNGSRYILWVLVALFASLICSGSSVASNEELFIADNGRTSYQIYVSASATPVELYAAEELSTFLSKVTGAKFPIQESNESAPQPLIMLSKSTVVAQLSAMGNASNVMASNGFLIHTKGEDLLITSNTSEGVLSGVYYFLENYLWCRWYSADFMVIPHRDKVTIPSTYDVQVPRFPYREVFSADADDLAFYVRNRMNGQLGHRALQHHDQRFGSLSKIRTVGVQELISPSKYDRSHPEFFGGGQLRFGKASVRATAVEAVLGRLARWPKEPYYLLISPADINSYYYGEEDKALIDAGGAPGTAFVDFVRVIADATRNQYPQVTVLALAYTWSRKPPTNLKLPMNMGIMLADIEINFSKSLKAEENHGFLNDLNDWAKLTDSIIIWDYITNFNGYLQPYPNIRILGKNLKILSGWPQVKGIFEQGSYGTPGGELAELRAWVLSKLLWNPDQDDQLLIKQFLLGYYGPASSFIEDYLHLLEKSIQEHPTYLAVKVAPTAPYLSAEFLGQADQIFREAEQAVRNRAEFLAHVQVARLGIDYAILFNHGHFHIDTAKQGTNSESYDNRYNRFKQYLKIANVKAYREGGSAASAEALLEILSIQRNPATPPETCKDLSPQNCIDFQDINFRLAGDARFVPDAMASDGSTVRMSGDSAVWGIQLPLSELPPEGKWKVYFSGRIEKGLGEGDDIAYKAGIHPSLARREMTMNQVADKGYLELMLPGMWTRDQSKYVWLAPPQSRAIKAFYIDRIFAVRTDK